MDYTPRHYFCKFELPLDTDIVWQLDIYRYSSFYTIETLQVNLVSGIETQYDDTFLRRNSYIYTDNGIGNTTSHRKVDVRRNADSVVVYARNNVEVRGKTFRIYLQKDVNAKSWLENMLSMAITIIASCLCCCVMAGVVRCYVNKTHNIDFNVDEPNPDWDEDIIRVYYIRRL